MFGTDHAKLGLNVAELIGNYSILEISLYQALADMLDDGEGAITEAILSRVDSVSYKMGVVFDIARTKAEQKPVAKVLLEHETEIRKLTSFRNKLAHGLFLKDQEGNSAVATNTFRVGRQAMSVEPLNRPDVVNRCQRIITIMNAINAAATNERINLHGGRVVLIPGHRHGEVDVGEPTD